MFKDFSHKLVFTFLLMFLLAPIFVSAATEGERSIFFIDSSYDIEGREEISARLEKISLKAYFYLEEEWYEDLTDEEKESVSQKLEELSQEFDGVIYPQLTSVLGEEWSPGIDNDKRVTVLFHRMKSEAAGYFNDGDEFSRVQNEKSNEREMVYLNSDVLFSSLARSYLAHEFVHLITFNQKNRLRGVTEEIWLNEARADYAPTLLGYDENYQGSNLQQRVRNFINSPSDSLTEWQNQKKDYGVVNLFTQYLVEIYGRDILVDSLHSNKVGISSLEYALKKAGIEKSFRQIFTDWTVAVFLNDCKVDESYCYKNSNLKNIKVNPSLIFLPSTQKTSVSLNYSIKQWSGNWYRIMGGEGELKLEFNGEDNLQFSVPYVLCKDSIDCKVGFLELDENQKASVYFEDFGKNYTSLTLIPSIQSKTSGFDGREPSYSFSLSSTIEITTEQEKLIEELKARIAELQAQIAELQAKIAEILREKISCQIIDSNLYFGLRSPEVSCLQEFLKAQGSEIYPEGLITGFFGPLTQAAVMRFQEKYAEDILEPLGLKKGTGFVGASTRSKINQILGK